VSNCQRDRERERESEREKEREKEREGERHREETGESGRERGKVRQSKCISAITSSILGTKKTETVTTYFGNLKKGD